MQAPVVDGGLPQLDAQFEINGQTFQRDQVWQLIQKGRFILIFVVVIILKFIFDNIMIFAFLVASHLTLQRIKSNFEEQISLRRTKIRVLTGLLVLALITLEYISFVSAFFFDDKHFLSKRLLLMTDNTGKELSFFDVIWRCAVTDLAVMILGEAVKIVVLILFSALLSKFPYLIDSRINQVGGLSDVENGNSTSHSIGSTSTFISSYFHLASESLRRRDTQTGGNHLMMPVAQVESSTSSTSEASENDGNIRNHDSLDSSQYLFHRRLITIVDVLILAYRTMLPCPLWLVYLKEGSILSAFILPIIYMACKIFDISWKLSASFEAISHLVMGRLEYGHYATEEDISECPICFDSPQRPVALVCGHAFCECCIHEWTERERSCPVCRATLTSESKYLDAVKSDISSVVPIII